ncbi:hypothetical protein HX886_28465, partial [Pseudomonas gingeri]|nr:hypothetical protein [Pseudomonas gingeri]NWC37214.1 hypothetical protein [Pseudomonas gingeri]
SLDHYTARTEGQVLRFKVKTANTGASTINDGVGVVALVGGAHSALQGGELIVNGDAWIQWNTSIGGGSYILLFCTGAPEQVAPATQPGHAVNAGQIQAQSLSAFTTGGTAPAFTLTPVPAITAYAANQRFQVTFNAAGTTPTLNVSGLGAKNLKQYTATGAKIAAIIASGQTSDVVYDGTDLVVLDQLPNSVGVTPAQFDNSTNLATTQFVQGVGLQFSSSVLASANLTLTAASHAGAVIIGNSSSAINVTLPLISTMPVKTAIKFWNYSAGTMTLVASGSDSIYLPASVTTFPLPTGAFITLVSSGAGAWFAVDMSGLGVGQAWQNMGGGRVVSTSYANASGRPISVSYNGQSSSGGATYTAVVAGNTIINTSQAAATTNFNIAFIVPPGATYSITQSSGTSTSWWELR